MQKPKAALKLVLACVLAASLLGVSTAQAKVRATALDAYEYNGALSVPYDNTYLGARASSLGVLYAHTFQTDDVAQMVAWHYDQDFGSVSLTAGHTYRFIATPTPGVSGADPVLYLYDPLNMTTDPPEVLRSCDDATWLTTDLGASFFYTASATRTYYYSIDDEWGTGYTGARWTSQYSKGPTYAMEVVDFGVMSSPDMRQWVETTGPYPFAADRYWLAAAMAYNFLGSSPSFSGLTDVIIASGLDNAAADPLASAGLAGVYNAPLLLVRGDRPSTLPGGTAWALAQIKADNPGTHIKFHIVGGPASVPDSLKAKVLAASVSGSTIERIGGADRYAVAANIAARMRAVQGPGYAESAFFVNGHDAAYFWNALMCGPAAFQNHWPILLLTRGSIPGSTNAAKAHYTQRYVVGSKVDVTDANAAAVIGASGFRVANPTTKAGTAYDRQRMARFFAERAEHDHWIGGGGSVAVVGITNKLADSLAGGIFMGKKNGPLIYSTDWLTFDQATEEYLQTRRPYIGQAWCFGGPASFSLDLDYRAQALLGSGD